MSTRDEIVAKCYALSGDPSDVEEFDEDEILLPKIEDVVSRICKGIYINPVTEKVYRGGYLPFLDESVFYTAVPTTTLTADVATTDLTISFDTTNFLTGTALIPQYVLINGDIISYEGVTATTITGVTGIDTTHEEGDTVYQLYRLPSSITKPHTLRQVLNTQNRIKVDHRDFRQPIDLNRYYTILRDGEVDLLNIVGYGSEKFMLFYNNKNTTMATGATVCIIPDCTELVAHLAMGELLREYEEEDGASKIAHGCALLDEMYRFYAKQTKDTDRRIVSGNPVTMSKAYGGTYSRGQFRII